MQAAFTAVARLKVWWALQGLGYPVEFSRFDSSAFPDVRKEKSKSSEPRRQRSDEARTRKKVEEWKRISEAAQDLVASISRLYGYLHRAREKGDWLGQLGLRY